MTERSHDMAAVEPARGTGAIAPDGPLEVSVDQSLCTGDGLCVQLAAEVFEFDVDGLAYVKDSTGELQLTDDARAVVPMGLVLEVIEAATECPGECIHVVRAGTDEAIAGPRAALPA